MKHFRTEIRGTSTESHEDGAGLALFSVSAHHAASATSEQFIELPIDTHFVARALPNNLTALDSEQWSLRVAARVLESHFLHQKVREEGGAYGVSVSAAAPGMSGGGVIFSSYRDPNPSRTTSAFDMVSDWLQHPNSITEERVNQAKLQIFAQIDAERTPDCYGNAWHLSRITYDQTESIRAGLRAVCAAQVKKDVSQLFCSDHSVRTVTLQPAQTPCP